jgi:hypothetical protein
MRITLSPMKSLRRAPRRERERISEPRWFAVRTVHWVLAEDEEEAVLLVARGYIGARGEHCYVRYEANEEAPRNPPGKAEPGQVWQPVVAE